MPKDITIGIVGLGYWGPNLLRNFHNTEGMRVKYVCDLSDKAIQAAARQYPSILATKRYEDLLEDTDIDAVAIATPVQTHGPLALAAIRAGKHVLVEKPLAGTAEDAHMLVNTARKVGTILMVDHTFVYEPAVQKIQEYAENGTLGKILYFDSTRINLGIIQSDTNVLWDLAVHDLSILAALRPLSDAVSVYAEGQKHHTQQEEIAHMHLTFPDGMSAHIAVSWLSPVKIRQTLIGGTDRMVLYNDNEPSDKIRLYDKGVSISKEEQSFALPVYRSGDVLIPRLQVKEPLAELARHFAACVRGEEEPKTSGRYGADIVRILECATESIRNGSPVLLPLS